MTEIKKIEYKKLPQDIREAIESARIDETVAEISKKFSLHVDQSGIVYEITNTILLGRVSPSEFIPTLTNSAKIERETATEIAKVINEKVFLAVRESLKKIHGVGEEAVPREAAPLEKKNDVLQAIEAPENVPMHSRVMEASAPSVPSTAPRMPETPEPAVVKTAPVVSAPAPEVPPASAPIPPVAAPVVETPAETPAPVAPPAAKVSTAKAFDPYRELTN